MRSASAGTGPAAPAGARHADGDIHHVDPDVGVRGIAVAVGTGVRVAFGLFDLAFLDHFLALDHAAAAVGAVVLAFFARHAAARAELVILDLRAGDLLLGLRFGAEAGTAEDIFEEFNDGEDRKEDDSQRENSPENAGNDVEEVCAVGAAVVAAGLVTASSAVRLTVG